MVDRSIGRSIGPPLWIFNELTPAVPTLMTLFCTTGQTIFYNVIRSTGWTDQISSHWIHSFDSTRLNHYFFLIFYIMALPNFESCGMSLGCILLPRSQCVSSAAVLDLSASRSVRPDFGPFGNPHICQYRTSGS